MPVESGFDTRRHCVQCASGFVVIAAPASSTPYATYTGYVLAFDRCAPRTPDLDRATAESSPPSKTWWLVEWGRGRIGGGQFCGGKRGREG